MSAHLVPQPNSNPALKNLAGLVGMWKTEMVFPADPSTKIAGHVSFERLEEGAFLLMRLPVEADSPSKSIWMIGRDDAVSTYIVFYFDTRRVSRIYQMSFDDGVWRMWRESPGFSQRYTGAFSDDRNSITGQWEKSGDGLNWEHDFDLTYTKVG